METTEESSFFYINYAQSRHYIKKRSILAQREVSSVQFSISNTACNFQGNKASYHLRNNSKVQFPFPGGLKKCKCFPWEYYLKVKVLKASISVPYKYFLSKLSSKASARKCVLTYTALAGDTICYYKQALILKQRA